MTGVRVAMWGIILVIPYLLWSVMEGAKNDLLTRSRYLVKRAHEAGPENERAVQSFYIKYRFPEGNPDRQERLFDRIWLTLAETDADEVAYAGDERVLPAENGRPLTFHDVRIAAHRRDGDRTTLLLHWVRLRGRWYLHGCDRDGEALDAI